MLHPRSILKKTAFGFATVLVTLLFPGASYAETTSVPTAPAAQTAVQAPAATTGPQQPTGADGKTYHLNPETKNWENDHYIWDPATKQTTAKNPTYTYDDSTGHWNSDAWQYNAPSSSYQKVAPVAATAEETKAPGVNSTPSSPAATTAYGTNTGTTLANSVGAAAQSGNATVTKNTAAGSATTGDAVAMTTVMNLLQSGVNLGNGNTVPQTFVADVYGDVTGDMVLDPTLLTLLQPAGSTQGWEAIPTKLTVQNSGRMQNDIVLDAGSGDAAVIANTSAGDATTGDAHAVANVVNVANSGINANGSFLGAINIYGNLDGDILLPPEVMQKLLASNAPTLTLNTSKIENGQLLANLHDEQTITNTITTTASSGNATVARNTSAGNATSGGASTNITVLNLTGREITADNSLLVFVNVLGKWIGVILDAPDGTTAAAMGQNATSTALAALADATIDSNNKLAIANNANVNARSGNATVANNTLAGNAKTGDATASVNILNMTNSNLSLTGWFGILFINVFGRWSGSFGVDTPAGMLATSPGSQPAVPSQGRQGGNAIPPAAAAVATKKYTLRPTRTQARVFAMSTAADGQYRIEPLEDPTLVGALLDPMGPTGSSGMSGSTWAPATLSSAIKTPPNDHTKANWQFAAGGLAISCVLLAVERLNALRHRRMAKA